ncbi:hypothetical protein CerSpe_017890 [Prunus speciosa]
MLLEHPSPNILDLFKRFSHLAWVQTDRKSGGLGDLNYPLIYDVTKSISKSYGVLIPDQHIIGRTDVDILTGVGVKESQDFKEVLEKRLHAKREITFETPLFGSKTFLIYVEPVFSKAGETFGEEKRKDGKA